MYPGEIKFIEQLVELDTGILDEVEQFFVGRPGVEVDIGSFSFHMLAGFGATNGFVQPRAAVTTAQDNGRVSIGFPYFSSRFLYSDLRLSMISGGGLNCSVIFFRVAVWLASNSSRLKWAESFMTGSFDNNTKV